MSTNDMSPIWPSLTYKWVDVATLGLIILLGVFVGYQSYLLDPGYGPNGPAAGFWPFWLNTIFVLGAVIALIQTFRNPDERPFFEVTQEVKDLVAVTWPVLASVLLIYWLGVFATSAVYIAFFMWWYGRFAWYTSIASGAIFGVVLWFVIRMGFNLSMPMSWLYYQNITPF